MSKKDSKPSIKDIESSEIGKRIAREKQQQARFEFTQRFFGKKMEVNFTSGKKLVVILLNVASDGLVVELLFNKGEAFIPWESIMFVSDPTKKRKKRVD